MGWKGKSVVSAKEFTRKDMEDLFSLTREIKKDPDRFKNKLKDKIAALLFFEPSTRTHESFRVAAENLGMGLCGFANPKASSVAKGESLIDTVRMFAGYGADIIIMRHGKAGAARYISEEIDVPVINAGDDSNEHPTQALLDCFTIWETFGKLDNLVVGMVGDLKYGRTVPSLAYALSNYNVEMHFIAPSVLRLRDHVKRWLDEKGVSFKEHDVSDLRRIIKELDVLYVTRIQKERMADEMEYEKVKKSYTITSEMLKGVGESFIVMHPLPRVDEIRPEVDVTKHAAYFRQAANGMYTRWALIYSILKV